jgi:flavin-dependent dehydrogenase
MKLQSWSSAVTRFWGPGWVVTGNAGEFLDPIFSSGVTLALESASLAAKLVARSLKGESVDWEKSYASIISGGINVFKAFVHSWYRNELPQVIFARNKTQQIKQAITAILGGYVLDSENPFVRNAEETLAALLKVARPGGVP